MRSRGQENQFLVRAVIYARPGSLACKMVSPYVLTLSSLFPCLCLDFLFL